jgi:carbon storage regulator CsrA
MLVLSRKQSERIKIGEAIVEIRTIGRGRVVLSVDAPPHVKILRMEIVNRERNDEDETAPE